MVQIDASVCKQVGCEFLDKKTNICSRALVFRKPKKEVCISTVPIRFAKRNGR